MKTANQFCLEMGERFKARRLYKGLSRTTVAKHLGMTVTGYSYFELGKRQADIVHLRKLGQIFECSVSDIFGETRATTSDTEEDALLSLASSSRSSCGHRSATP